MDVVLVFLFAAMSTLGTFFATLYSGTAHHIAQGAAAGFGCAAAFFWGLSVVGYII
jgi:hypothetical protein